MRSRLRPSGFSHSRSFSAPTVPSLRLTPPTPHGSFHEKDYDSDDSVPTSAAAMPRPNRYRRPGTRTTSHPYAVNGQPSSSSPTFPPEQYQSINPGFFRGKLDGKTVAAFSVVIAPDGTVTIQGQLVPKPNKYPSQDVQERRSLSQPTSPLFFQTPIDPSIAALGLQNPPSSPTTGETVSPQPQTTSAPLKPQHTVPLVEHPSAQVGQMYLEQYSTYLAQYQAEQQNMWMWPVEQIPVSHT